MDTQAVWGAVEWLITGYAIVSFTVICGLVKSHIDTKIRVATLEAREEGRNGRVAALERSVKEGFQRLQDRLDAAIFSKEGKK